MVGCTTGGYLCGAFIGGGAGTLTIKDGTATVCQMITTSNPTVFTPPVPVAHRTSIIATCSGTSVCTLYFIKTP
jgi:hypothetical protein